MTEVDIFKDPDQEVRPPTGPSFGNIMFGVVLIAIGVTWLLSTLDVVQLSWRSVLAGALILIGVGLIIGAGRGAHGGLITAGVMLTVILGMASTAEGVLDVPLTGGIGDSTYTPASLDRLASPYRLTIGDLTVDLRSTEFNRDLVDIEASVAIGQLTVLLPDDVAVEVIGSVGAGRLLVGDTEYSGTGVDEIVTDAGFADAPRRLRLTIRVGLGDAEVRR